MAYWLIGLLAYCDADDDDADGGALPVAAWCVSTTNGSKDKDANMSLVRQTVTKRFNLSTWEFASADKASSKPPLKRKASGADDDSGFPEVSVDVQLSVLKPKRGIGETNVKLTVAGSAEAPPIVPLSAVEDVLAAAADAKKADESNNKPKAKKPTGGTWSAKHLLR